jgi:opacity protein-like surface antigen
MRRIIRTVATAALAVTYLSTAHADDIVPSVMSPPAHTELRYDEDYSYLKYPAARTNSFDSLKYISLNAGGDSYLTLGGQLRDRYENFQNYTFVSGPQSPDGYNLLRAMADADLHLGQYVRVFVEGLSATEQGRVGGPRPSDVNAAALYQAFLDVKIPFSSDTSLTLRAGRQVIVFGAQRLIGVSDFTDVRRTDDGVRATLTTPGNTLDVFYARPVRVRPYEFDDDVPAGNYFAGIYDTWEVPGSWSKAMKTKLEMYAL